MERLPPEVGEQSLKRLSLKDLCSLTLTSSRVRTLASNPTLWSNMRVSREKIYLDGLANLFSIKRFSKIQKIDLSRMTFSSEEELQGNLKAISSSCVEELNLKQVDLSHVPVDLLAHTVGHVRKISLDFTRLSTPQCRAVLETCISSPALTNVSLGRNESMGVGVDASLLARAAVNLKMLSLDATLLTSEQCTAVLETCKDTSPLVYLNLGRLSFKEVEAPLLKQAVRHLQTFDLTTADLTTEQCYALLEACIANTTSKIIIHEHFFGFLVPDDLLDLRDKARDTGRLTERNYQQDDFVIDF